MDNVYVAVLIKIFQNDPKVFSSRGKLEFFPQKRERKISIEANMLTAKVETIIIIQIYMIVIYSTSIQFSMYSMVVQ